MAKKKSRNAITDGDDLSSPRSDIYGDTAINYGKASDKNSVAERMKRKRMEKRKKT